MGERDERERNLRDGKDLAGGKRSKTGGGKNKKAKLQVCCGLITCPGN